MPTSHKWFQIWDQNNSLLLVRGDTTMDELHAHGVRRLRGFEAVTTPAIIEQYRTDGRLIEVTRAET